MTGLPRVTTQPSSPPASDPPGHEFTRDLYGWITHTELATDDPHATQVWATEVLGWTFQEPLPTPAGDYRLFAYSQRGGGGIRATQDGEAPGVTPSVHVEDTDASYAAALAAGATSVAEPETLMPGVRVSLVCAPGGVLIGFSGPTDKATQDREGDDAECAGTVQAGAAGRGTGARWSTSASWSSTQASASSAT